MKDNEKDVIENIKKFLQSNNNIKKMEECFNAIRNSSNTRFFKDSMTELENNKFDMLFPMVSVVILTANKIECDSLNYIAHKKTNGNIKKRRNLLPIFGSNLYSCEAYIFKIDSSYVLHLRACETGSNTPGGSADLVRYISNNTYIRPNCIISFGICYGRYPQKQQIGNVLIPKKLYPWSVAQKVDNKRFYIKHDRYNFDLETEFAESIFYSILKDFYDDEDGRTLEDEIKFNNKAVESFSVNNILGNMSTGEAVVSSYKIKEMLREANKNEREIGGEMEGYGIAKECIFYAKIPCIIIKSICDWGECKNIDEILKNEKFTCPESLKDKLQAYAAFCAGISLFKLIDYDKKHFLSLQILNWLDSPERGEKRCGINNYVDKTTILENITKFYDIDVTDANKILNTLLENNYLELNGNKKYRGN